MKQQGPAGDRRLQEGPGGPTGNYGYSKEQQGTKECNRGGRSGLDLALHFINAQPQTVIH